MLVFHLRVSVASFYKVWTHVYSNDILNERIIINISITNGTGYKSAESK